jgi:hypothetical protein
LPFLEVEGKKQGALVLKVTFVLGNGNDMARVSE